MIVLPSEVGVDGVSLRISFGLCPQAIPRKTQSIPPNDEMTVSVSACTAQSQFVLHVALNSA